MNKNNFARIHDKNLNEAEFFDFCYSKLPDILEKRELNDYLNNIENYVFCDIETNSIKVHPDLIIALGGDPKYPPGWRKLRKKLLSI